MMPEQQNIEHVAGRQYRYIRGLVLFLVAVAGLCAYGGIGMVLVAIQYKWLWTVNGIILLAVDVGAAVVFAALIQKIIGLDWKFTLTSTHLIATHWLRRRRVEIPWDQVIAVRRLPRPWWARGGGGLGISVIETTAGEQIPFMTHFMLRYRRFLEELKTRAVNCREFDPYWDEWQ